MRRSIVGVVGVAALAAGGVAAGFAFVGNGDDAGRAAAETNPRSASNTASVTLRDLTRNEELDGTIGYGTASKLVLALDGTVTSLPAVGDEMAEGSVVAEIDGVPVIALGGDTPMWRDLGPGVSDGPDVLQIEEALARLGFAEEHDMTVDGDWTGATTRAVKDFQEAYGQDDDGRIELGEIVFLAGPVRVSAVDGVPGQQAPEAGIEVTASEQIVRVDLAAGDTDLLAVGADVTVELASGEQLAATVEVVGAAETDANGSTTLPVDIVVTGDTDIPIGTPVDVLVTTVAAEDVLAVPVEALLALAEGGYAVEVVTDAGTTLTRVELGTFAEGYVAIEGAVGEGTEVVLP